MAILDQLQSPFLERLGGRVGIDDNLTESDAREIVETSAVKILQTRNPISEAVWRLINDIVLRENPEIRIRIYWHSDGADLSFLPVLSNVRHLIFDLKFGSESIESLCILENLVSLDLNISDITTFEFLKDLRSDITELYLGTTRSKKPDLKFLERFKSLNIIGIRGHSKSIETLENLTSLNSVSLSGITVESFEYLYQLKKLDELYLDLVRSDALNTLSKLSIKGLFISEIRKLSDLGFIADFKELQYLSLVHLNLINSIPLLKSRKTLRRFFIENMKSLDNIEGIWECESLEDLVMIGPFTKLKVDNFSSITQLKQLKYARIGTGSQRKNDQIENILKEQSAESYNHYDFNYL